MRTLLILCLCMIISNHGLMAQDDFAPNHTILENASDQSKFQMYVDSMEKFLYRDTEIADRYFESCKSILKQGIPIPDSSLLDFVIQEIYYAHVKEDELAAYQIIEAHEQLLDAAEIPQKLKNTFSYIRGFTYMTIGDLAYAQNAFHELVQHGEKHRDTSQLVQGLFSLGQILSDVKDFDGATECFNRLLSFPASKTRPGTKALINFELSEIYYKQQQKEKAVDLIDSSLVFLEEQEINVIKPDFLLLKGEIVLADKDHQLAWEIYEQANELANKNQDPTSIRKSTLYKAEILSSEAKYSEALKIYETLLDQQDTTDLDQSLNLYTEAQAIYKKIGEDTKAYDYLSRSNAVQRKIQSEKKRQEIDYLKVKYESEKKENENQVLAIQVDQQISQNRLLYALTALFGLGILILFGAFFQKRKFNRKLKAEVRNRTLELEYANRQLINTNHELDEFNRILSHDLKEPIRSLVGFSTLLKKKGVQSEEAEDYLGFIEESGKQLYETLSAVSAFQHTATQGIPKTEAIDISQLVENIILAIRRKQPEKRIHYSGIDLPVIHTNRTAIETIFKELIDNAVKFNPHNTPEITIKYDQKAGSHCFEVHDNGIGIAPEYREQVFGMFKRLHGRNTYGGAGLGLNIAMKMAKRLNGNISILRSEENKGSTFQFDFPADV